MISVEEAKRLVKKNLSEKRCTHTMNVARLACQLRRYLHISAARSGKRL